MSIFKIKLQPIVKEREYKVSHVKSGRKNKTCEICHKLIIIGKSSTSFTKITSVGTKNSYETHHACSADEKTNCAKMLAEKLNTELYES
jgi:hypothetical protein